jgi:hypothetical protein
MRNHHVHWNSYYKYRNMFCGPSRIVWFAFGSVATWAWIRHREQNPQHHCQGGWGHRRVDYGFDAADGGERRQTSSSMSREWQRPPMSMGQGQGTGIISTPGAPGPQMQQSTGDKDVERLRQIGRNAEETVRNVLRVLHSLMSDETDSSLSFVE